MNDPQTTFAQNRAEEIGPDVLGNFVVPLFFDDLNVTTQTKALVIVGGRGCGKTTLLHYFSHYTAFSPRRQLSNLGEDLTYIGLYHRADTNFLSALQGQEVSDRVWESAFRHYLACNFGLEILESIRSINHEEHRRYVYGNVDNLDFSSLRDLYDPGFGVTFDGLYRSLSASRSKLATWVNNLETVTPPVFLPIEDFLKRLIALLRDQLTYLRDSSFAVFIDEYENLLLYQKKMINGLLKHGSRPLLFNIAMKRNSFSTKETLGPESIQDIHDYNTVDLESKLMDGFDLFAAEILCFKLRERHPSLAEFLPVDPAVLRDPKQARWRREDALYRQRVLSAAGKLLPKMTEKEVASAVLQTSSIRERLISNIATGLAMHGSKMAPESFIDNSVPEASIVCSALLNRRRESPEDILEELNLYRAKKPNRFIQSDWLHNNLFGVLLQLYSSGQLPCPLYAGFDTFKQLAHGNLRHFLALVHEAFLRRGPHKATELPSVPIPEQADVVRAVSHGFLSEVRGAGKKGNQLQAMALTLGAVFKQKHRLLAQSEPEINHFRLIQNESSERLEEYLAEAVKWSVLFEQKETKKKSIGAATHEYVLNPIFSGYFQISFRKKRNLRLTGAEVLTMFSGSLEDKDRLVRMRTDNENQGELALESGLDRE